MTRNDRLFWFARRLPDASSAVRRVAAQVEFDPEAALSSANRALEIDPEQEDAPRVRAKAQQLLHHGEK